MVKAGFTGTRKGMTKFQIQCLEYLLRDLRIEELHHGDCVGADEEADVAARGSGVPRVIHPPQEQSQQAYCQTTEGKIQVRNRKPYLERNHDIVDETDILIAAPGSTNEALRSGTWATVRYARKQGKRIIILYP